MVSGIKGFFKKLKIIVAVIIVLIIALIILGYLSYIKESNVYAEDIANYNSAVTEYNEVAKEFEAMKSVVALDNIQGLPETEVKNVVYSGISGFIDFDNDIEKKELKDLTQDIKKETEELLYAILVARQITNPTQDWVIERLGNIDGINNIEAVSKANDPNGFLGAEGGYTACIYFESNDVEQSQVKGSDTISKGTDAGGCIEVYKTKADAEARCEYLGQFDNTLLYSGSYAIVGTTVIRTSYLLSNEQQVELTKEVTKAFTEII